MPQDESIQGKHLRVHTFLCQLIIAIITFYCAIAISHYDPTPASAVPRAVAPRTPFSDANSTTPHICKTDDLGAILIAITPYSVLCPSAPFFFLSLISFLFGIFKFNSLHTEDIDLIDGYSYFIIAGHYADRDLDASPDDEAYCFPEIQHPNFVNIYERYLFQKTFFAITEYVGFSIDDLLPKSIYPTEREIAYIVLAGIQFIWSRSLDHPRISTKNILVSSKGEVKIDLTPPDDIEHSSADLSSLGTVMILMMDETRETLKSTALNWSAEAVNIVEATSSTTPNELSGHVFIIHPGGTETLAPLLPLAQVTVWKDKYIDKDARKRRR